MPPILKDSDVAVATSTSGATATTVAKPKDESPARPQPVALEIPVTVNGARTVEGSDKREPFSECTKTVLVFSHGAVIRLASSLAPGQLVFLTNDRTKKEVVCQVIKSKNYRSVTGYVELEFTEPAIGFWGMRFPSEHSIPAAPAAVVPPRAAVPAGVSLPPKAAPMPPPAPSVVAKSITPVAPMASSHAPEKPVTAPPPSLPMAPKSEPLNLPAPAHSLAPPATPSIARGPEKTVPVAPAAPLPPSPLATKPQPVTPKGLGLPMSSPDYTAAISALFDPPAAAEAKPASISAPKTAPSASAEPSTEQLKMHTARLQEQLSSLLFTETPGKQPSPPASAGNAKNESPLPEVADKLLHLAQVDVKSSAPPEPKSAAPVRNFVPPSLADEHVKVPAWLAPLAHESETATSEAVAVLEQPVSHPDSLSTSAGVLTDGITEPHRRQHSAVFGGQLTGETPAATPVVASRSKKGIFIGIAAAIVLAAGVTWYLRQPDNPIMSLLISKPAPVRVANPSPAPEPKMRPAAPAVNTKSLAIPEPSNPAVTHSEPPVSTATAPPPTTSPSAKNLKTSPRETPRPEEPKKSSVGEVHLATPVVNRAGGSTASNESEPSININGSSSAEPLASLGAGHRAEPTAPLPVGGDVKQVRLVKKVAPIYPTAARSENISGTVTVDALVDVSGNVAAAKVISGAPIFHQAALNAVKQWKYEPAQLNGKPTAVHITVSVLFRNQ